MNWDQCIGHRRQRAWFAAALNNHRLTGSFLFVGPPGIGKSTFATLLAKTLLCDTRRAAALDPCGRCPACAQVDADTHPDILRVAKPGERAFIPVELFVGKQEERMKVGFCRDIQLRPFAGTRRIGIIQDADYLNEEGANSLLKTLEEPPLGALIILIGTTAQRQLPTIRSRCRTIRFLPPTGEDAARLLAAHGAENIPATDAQRLIERCEGNVYQAMDLLQPEGQGFCEHLEKLLSAEVINAVTLSTLVNDYVTAAGKDAPSRRNRMRQVFSITLEFFRNRVRQQPSASEGVQAELNRINRCLTAMNQVDRNANQATLIESWSADLQRGSEVLL